VTREPRLVDVMPTVPGLTAAAAAAQWAVPGRFLAVPDGGRFVMYERAAVLAGAAEPVRSFSVPAGARAALHPSGAFAVAATRSAVRAIDPDGVPRWELPHDPWHVDQRRSTLCTPAVSPDGRWVSMVLPRLAHSTDERPILMTDDGSRWQSDRVVLIDAASGAAHPVRTVFGTSSTTTQLWHPDSTHVLLSCWMAWYSWTMYRLTVDGPRLEGGLTYREGTAWGPDAGTTLSVRRAEHMALDMDVDNVAVHAFPSGDELHLIDLAGIGGDPETHELDTAVRIDEVHVLVSLEDRVRTHRLLSWPTLEPLGELAYPAPVTSAPVPLGDGTWLTVDNGQLRRWSLAHN
jgi:hypothetical protein